MYKICVRDDFSGAHNLRGYAGKCENLHGHNWKVEVRIASKKTDSIGMVMDFKTARKYLADVLGRLDHKHLNKTPYFMKHNPTSENIAKFIYDALSKRVRDIAEVTVWETDNASASYSK
ncbi:MAG: 6-carboxytetrahydropterin synthase QueD [Candidatus Omnitrophota bacterium]